MVRSKTILQTTNDGSHTLFVPELDEHYHSTNGAVEESRHVFIRAGLHACQMDVIRVFEVGFGTGLNAFLTYLDALESHKKISYTSIELYPVSVELADLLNYPSATSAAEAHVFRDLHQSPWNEEVDISDFFHLKKIQNDLNEWSFGQKEQFDIVFFDAFAPDKQPEMWTQKIFDCLFQVLSPGGIFVTYCAKGIVRRMLQKSGFEMERLPGPPGKREMLRGKKVRY
jgi:tRNA U34 5-methylaminomethyl-2-thiouridine-forming methyltransferase MnmC